MKWSYSVLSTILLLLVSASASAQNAQPKPSSTDKLLPRLVTASAAADSIRFASLGELVQMRLEVIGGSGETLFDSAFKPGNLIDWAVSDEKGQRLVDGTYLCVVAVKERSGQIIRKQAIVSLHDHSLGLRQSDRSLLSDAQAQAAGANADEDASLTILEPDASAATAVVAHDGGTAHLVSGSGGLSISSGDFFANKILEHIRLTAEGNLGVGTPNPQAKLDVAGLIRSSQGIVFPDGSIQYSASRKTFGAESLRPGESPTKRAQGENFRTLAIEVSGTGTTGKIPKWLDGPTGALNDSNITEVNGAIGINGAPSTSFRLDVNGSTRIRGSNPGFNLVGLRPAGNEWVFQTVDDDGRFRLFGQDNTTSAERFTISLNGNVGIGSTAPNHLLTVGTAETPLVTSAKLGIYGANSSFVIARDTTHHVEALFGADNSSVGGAAGASLYGSVTNHSIQFRTNNASKMVITAPGNVGIGTTTPNTRLDVVGANSQMRFGSSTSDNGGYLISTGTSEAIIAGGANWNGTSWTAKSAGSSHTDNGNGMIRFYTDIGLTNGSSFIPSERMRIAADGKVGIGTNTPTAKLDVAGNIAFAPQTAYLSISPVAFNPAVIPIGFLQTSAFIRPFWGVFDPPFPQEWNAPVNLPDGAIVTEFRVLIGDTDDTRNVAVDLVGHLQDNLDAAVVKLASVTSNTLSAPPPTFKLYTDVTINSPVIDNSRYTYSVYFQVLSDSSDKMSIGAVRIKYTYTHP